MIIYISFMLIEINMRVAGNNRANTLPLEVELIGSFPRDVATSRNVAAV